MGLIRKSLMISTGGLVRGSSKKQRVARAQLNQLKEQTNLLREHEQRELEEQHRRAAAALWPPMLPAPGWMPDQHQPGVLRWWDGQRWTEHTQALAPPPGS